MRGKKEQPRKIVCIHHGIGIGGAPLSLIFVLRTLDRTSFQPKVLCLYDSDAVNLFRNSGIDVRILNAWRHFSHSEVHWIKWNRPDQLLVSSISWFITAFFYAKKILRDERPDIVYLNSTPLSAWAIAAKALNLPVVCHVREPIQQGYCGIRKTFLRSILKKNTDRFIAISEQNARSLDIPEKTKIVYNFVHFDEFDRNIAPSDIPLKARGYGKVVLYLGGAATIKGFEIVIEALEYLNPDILVLFGGYYPDNRSYKKSLRRLFKPSMTHLLDKFESASNALNIGLLKDVPRWIAASDVIICPFVVPHFARSIIEAGAMGKPVVASNVDGMEELVVDGETGILVTAGNAKALAKAINRLCSDEGLATVMGEAGYKRAKMLFNAEHNGKATLKVFEDLLS